MDVDVRLLGKTGVEMSWLTKELHTPDELASHAHWTPHYLPLCAQCQERLLSYTTATIAMIPYLSVAGS